jgi:hypothetical protein
MPEATHDPTMAAATPSRRGLLTGGAAALLAGATIATAAPGAPPRFLAPRDPTPSSCGCTAP